MTMYAVQAAVTTTDGEGWMRTTHLPTFYLNDLVQGFTGEEGAEKVARSMLLDLSPSATVHAFACSDYIDHDGLVIR